MEDIRSTTKSRIIRTVDEIASNPAAILAFIRSGTPRDEAAKQPAIEQYVSYAWSYWRRHKSLDGFSGGRSIDPAALGEITAQIALADAELTMPDDVVIRNHGISPVAMQSLLQYFTDRGRDPLEYLPSPASSNDAVESYVRVIERIDKYLSLNVFGVTSPRRYRLALLVVGWMRGYPLSRLISSWLGYLTRNNRPIRLAQEIRSVMADVENVARFIAPKYIGCYIDVLRIFLTESNRMDLAIQLSDVTLQLELGASTKTQISLMGLGLTRTTAVEIAELVADSELNKQGCLKWLADQQWKSIDLPNLMKSEIQEILTIYKSASA